MKESVHEFSMEPTGEELHGEKERRSGLGLLIPLPRLHEQKMQFDNPARGEPCGEKEGSSGPGPLIPLSGLDEKKLQFDNPTREEFRGKKELKECAAYNEEIEYLHDFISWMHLEGLYAEFREKARKIEQEEDPFPRYTM